MLLVQGCQLSRIEHVKSPSSRKKLEYPFCFCFLLFLVTFLKQTDTQFDGHKKNCKIYFHFFLVSHAKQFAKDDNPVLVLK